MEERGKGAVGTGSGISQSTLLLLEFLLVIYIIFW